MSTLILITYSITVRKKGESEVCEYNEYYYDTGFTTEWGCTHMGDALISNFKNGEEENISQNETATIDDGNGGRFMFTIDHYFTKNELYYDQDYKMYGTMTLMINGKEKGKYSHPKNANKDTHLEDGAINPEFNGRSYVSVQCDNNCDCEIEQIMPKCELRAVLSQPELDEAPYYGYTSD